MTPQEMKALADGLIPVISRAVMEARAKDAEKIAALELRILELETRPTVNNVAGQKGEQGERGAAGERGEQGPAGPAGLNGKDAEPVDIEAVVERVKALIPTPKDGRDGERGAQGERGEVGPAGKDGAPGKDGEQGLRGERGDTGLQGASGRDGRDGLPGVQGEKGLDGKNGVDGVDGLGFDDFDLIQDEKGFALELKRGDRVKRFPLPILFDAGVFEAGKSYPLGAGVTHEGHYFVAKSATVQEPGEGSTDWRLAVRRGKQGRDGKPGPQGQKGEKGDDGRQGPQGPMGRPVGV